VAALPDSPSYDEISALTTHRVSGLEVVAHRLGHYMPSPAYAQDYARVLDHAAPHYPVVLTDWAPLELGPQAAAVLAHTDRLILCCGTRDTSVDAAVRSWRTLRGDIGGELADTALVAATDVEGSGPFAPALLAQRLGLTTSQVVHIPADPALQTRGWKLERLRPATVDAYLRLAYLALEPSAG
jgi:hypothetical protein